MDERKFLDKIRKMQESGEKIKLTEVNDVYQEFLKKDKIRLDETKRIFREFNNDDNIYPTETEEGQDISPDEQREEENAFKDTVTQLVQFEKIKVYRQNVEWSGTLVREKINWIYTLEDSVGCYISTEDDDVLQLTDDVLNLIKKIRAYYDIWSEEWASRLTGGAPSEGGDEGFGGPEPGGEGGEPGGFAGGF